MKQYQVSVTLARNHAKVCHQHLCCIAADRSKLCLRMTASTFDAVVAICILEETLAVSKGESVFGFVPPPYDNLATYGDGTGCRSFQLSRFFESLMRCLQEKGVLKMED